MAYTPTDKDFQKVLELSKKGALQRELAEHLGISLATLKRKMDLFEPYIKKGKELAIIEYVPKVENALIKTCLGYFVEETVTETITDKKTKKVTGVKQKRNKKYIVPNVAAQIFYLCNNSDYTNTQNKETVDFDSYESEFDVVDKLHGGE